MYPLTVLTWSSWTTPSLWPGKVYIINTSLSIAHLPVQVHIHGHIVSIVSQMTDHALLRWIPLLSSRDQLGSKLPTSIPCPILSTLIFLYLGYNSNSNSKTFNQPLMYMYQHVYFVGCMYYADGSLNYNEKVKFSSCNLWISIRFK